MEGVPGLEPLMASTAMADLFEVLAEAHDRIFGLANELTGGASDPLATPKERKAIADRLVAELSRHEAAEEMIFWPLVRERVADGESMTGVALDQEKVGKRVLNELVHVSPGDEEFGSLTHTVAARLREHITYEQNVVWPKLQLCLSKAERAELGQRFARTQRWAPVRPHPHVPPKPALLKAVAPAAAILDRARNLFYR
jgi:Hemerythrin HHE cation binding domain